MTITRTELIEIIRNGENSGIEFKRDVIQNHDLAKELVAFTNFAGGMVLLGVEDDGNISGITRDKLEEFVMTACRDKIRPAIIPFYELFREIEPGKVEHPVWKEVNTWPKYLLDKFYAPSLVKPAEEQSQGVHHDD